jgi:hypothetical protein
LFEHGEDNANEATMQGYTDNYLRVSLVYDPTLVNTVVPVTLLRINGEGQITGGVSPIDGSSVDPMLRYISERRYKDPVAI